MSRIIFTISDSLKLSLDEYSKKYGYDQSELIRQCIRYAILGEHSPTTKFENVVPNKKEVKSLFVDGKKHLVDEYGNEVSEVVDVSYHEIKKTLPKIDKPLISKKIEKVMNQEIMTKAIQDRQIKLCKHGAALGNCKHGCH